MNRLFQHSTLTQNMVFLLLWIVGHWIAGFIIFLAIGSIGTVGTSELWFIVSWSLFTSSGFALAQKLLLDWFGKHTTVAIEQNVKITALLALVSGCFGYLVFQTGDRNPSNWMMSVGLIGAVNAVLPIIGQSWVLRRDVHHAWLWFIVWVLTLTSYGLFVFTFLAYALEDDIFMFGLLAFPIFVPISGITMLFLINSPRIGKEKRKNEMLTPP